MYQIPINLIYASLLYQKVHLYMLLLLLSLNIYNLVECVRVYQSKK
jgi:hypothetical protein